MPPINPQMVTLNCWVGWWNPHVIEIFKGYQTQFRMFIIMFYITSTHKTNVLPHSFGYFAILGRLGGVDHHPISDLHLFAGAEYRFAPRMARLSGASDKGQTSTT